MTQPSILVVLNGNKTRDIALKVLSLLLTLALTSCSHTSKNDGPPDFYVDETKIPNATPKPEPRAKYGNLETYTVFGKRYHTMKSSENYDEIGTASWYGKKFHAHKTSSGEPYNMLSMTAAHKTLPLPTYVEVTNLKNNKRIIVKVNDRGPFASNRIIDLSFVAAKKLGMIGHGTTHVRVKAINPYAFGTAEPFFADSRTSKSQHKFAVEESLPSTKNSVYLQVGAFRDKSHAERLQIRLSSLFAAPVQISNPSRNSEFYKVKIGPFHDIASANEITTQLRNMGMTPNKERI